MSQHRFICFAFHSIHLHCTSLGCVCQTLGSSSHPGVVPQEEGKTRDGRERDPEHQEAQGQDGLQGPP